MPESRDPSDGTEPEHRFGRRQHINNLHVIWRASRPSMLHKSKMLDREAIMEDLSVTGAELALPTDKHDKVGDHVGDIVSVCFDGVWGLAKVVRAVKDGGDGMTRWGVDFQTVEDEFMAVVDAHLVDNSPRAKGIGMRDWD